MLFKSRPKTPEKIEKRRRLWRKFRRGALWSLAIGFVLHSALNIYASTLLNRELAAIRQRGEPLQFSELAPPAVPDAQNAALLYARASKLLKFTTPERVAMGDRQRGRSPENQKIIQEALLKNQVALDLARRGGLMPKCRFPLDYQTSNSLALTFPYYAQMRELARLLNAAAKIEARKGDRAAAFRDVRAIFGMAQHLSDEPVLLGFLVSKAIGSVANNALAEVLNGVPLSALEASALENSLPKTDWNRAFTHCLMGDRVGEIDIFDKAQHFPMGNFLSDTGGDSSPSWFSYPMILLWRPVLKLDEVQLLRLWKPLLAAAAATPFSKQAYFEDRIMEDTPRYAILTRMLMPIFSRAADNRDRAEVESRQRQIALSLTVFRTRQGAYPAQLSEITALNGAALPLDPYGKKPFIYRRLAKGFALYSVGPNRKDERGANSTSQLASGSWVTADDIVWNNAPRETFRVYDSPPPAPPQ